MSFIITYEQGAGVRRGAHPELFLLPLAACMGWPEASVPACSLGAMNKMSPDRQPWGKASY